MYVRAIHGFINDKWAYSFDVVLRGGNVEKLGFNDGHNDRLSFNLFTSLLTPPVGRT